MKTPEPKDEISALVVELADLARHAPGKLGERVAALTIQQQAELALRLPAKERLELLLHAPKPMRLVRSLPDSELYLTVREIGPSDALPLVALSSASQIHHLLDLESWRGDRFDGNRAGAWVALLLEAGEPTIRRFLRSADDELLTLLFQRWIRVQPVETEDGPEIGGSGHTEAGDEQGWIAPDGYYRFSPTIKEHVPAVQRIAQIFFREDAERYTRIIWSALNQLPAEIEEAELQWRQSRLEEHGFPPWDEALSVYAPPEGLREHPPLPEPSDPDGLAAPRSPLRVPVLQQRLGAVLDGLPDEDRERVLHEFVALANHLLVADGADTGEPTAHRAALEKGAGYVGIALRARGAERPEMLRKTLDETPLIELFREGHARAVELQARARQLKTEGWAAGHARALELLDTPVRDRIESLLETRPLFFQLGEGETPGIRRPFRSMTEIDETRVGLEVAETIGHVMLDRLGLDADALIRRAEGRRIDPPRFSALLLTVLAWHACRGEVRGDPLPPDVLADFLRTVASRRTADPQATVRALDALNDELAIRLELQSREHALLSRFGRACLEQLAAECSQLDPGVPASPKDVTCLVIEDN